MLKLLQKMQRQKTSIGLFREPKQSNKSPDMIWLENTHFFFEKIYVMESYSLQSMRNLTFENPSAHDRVKCYFVKRIGWRGKASKLRKEFPELQSFIVKLRFENTYKPD